MATDLSDRAGFAAQRAIQLAERHDAELTAVYVLPAGLSEDLIATARIAFETQTRPARGQKSLRRSIRCGKPATEITDEAARIGADMVVVGAHGEHRLTDAILGSTPENVVRSSKVPVLVVRNFKPDRYESVVLAVEPSPVSARAAQFGCALTPESDHVVTHVTAVVGECLMRMHGVDESHIEQLREACKVQAGNQIDQLAVALHPAPTMVAIEVGHPPTRLLELCRHFDADLIVVGTGGRSDLGYLMLGSVAQRVLKHARSDVLVVPVAAE